MERTPTVSGGFPDRAAPPWVTAMLEQVSQSFESKTTENIIRWACTTFGDKLTIGTAFGVSGMVLIDIASRVCTDLDVFYLDTGLFFPETYDLIAQAESRYGLEFRRVTPRQTIKEQALSEGPRLWERNSDRCCHLRKVEPMERALEGASAWITGVRRDQAASRRSTPILRWNRKFEVVKIAPMANWTERDVWQYVHDHNVPYNPLHDQGYPSIGCWPCTRPVQEGEDARAGRWSGTSKTECGLHLAS